MRAPTGHIPHLRLVMHATAENTATSGPISIIVARVEVRLVLELLLKWQIVEGIAKSELSIYLFLWNTKVRDIEEALCPNSFDESLCQLRCALWGSILGKINVGHYKDVS